MLRTSRLPIAATLACSFALFCFFALVCSLATPPHMREPRAAAGQAPEGARARFAVIDSEYMAGKGVRLEGDPAVAADLKTFSAALGLKLFDIAKVRGAVLVADETIDVSEVFVAAVKARAAGGRFEVPAVNVPESRVAFVDTDAFGDPESGIKRLMEVFRTVDREFAPRRAELDRLSERAESASGDRREQLRREAQRRREEEAAALEKRVRELADPVYQEVARALQSFGKAKGISLLFDPGRMGFADRLPPHGLTVPADAPNVTREFISAYNSGRLKP